MLGPGPYPLSLQLIATFLINVMIALCICNVAFLQLRMLLGSYQLKVAIIEKNTSYYPLLHVQLSQK